MSSIVNNLPIVVKADKTYDSMTPENAYLGTELGKEKITYREIKPSTS